MILQTKAGLETTAQIWYDARGCRFRQPMIERMREMNHRRVIAILLLVSTNYFVNPDWLFPTPSDAASWEGLTRRANLIALCEAAKGQIDSGKMLGIIGTPLAEGGAMNELTVFQMVTVPETGMLWLRVIGGAGWMQIDLSDFLHE